MTKVLYTTKASATGGRDGQSATEDGALSVKLTTPKELGGAGGDGNNPEQLFAAGYAACFLGALKYVAAQKKVKVDPAAKVTTTVGIGPRDDGTGFGLAVEIAVHLPGTELTEAQALVDAAHIVCPYSNATKGSLDIHPKAV